MKEDKDSQKSGWSKVFVRHANEKHRVDLYEVERRIKVPFRSSIGYCGLCLTNFHPSGKWLIGLQIAKFPWMPLFSNAADGETLFKSAAKSRCLEAVHVGFDPAKRGWFVQWNREGKAALNFSLPVKFGGNLEKAKFDSTEIDASILKKCTSGEEAVNRLCRELRINPTIELIYDKSAVRLLGEGGEPFATDEIYCFAKDGPALAKGENPASDALVRAIDKCDSQAIRDAVTQGASLDVLPDTSTSPLLSALFKCCNLGGKDCVAALVELGCPIDGPDGAPTVFHCVEHFINETLSLEMLKTLVSLGGNVKAIGRHGETALFTPVVYRRMSVVRFLLAQGVDPAAKDNEGKSVIDWLEDRLKRPYGDDSELQDFAKILDLCKVKTVEDILPASEALSAEQSGVVRQQIAKCLGIEASKIGPQSTIFGDLGARPEDLEPMQQGIEKALGISIEAVTDGVSVRIEGDEKGNITYDSLGRLQAYLSKWTAPLSPTPYRCLFTVGMIEAMVAKAFEEKAEETVIPPPLAPKHSAAVRRLIAKEAGVSVADLKPETNLLSDLKIEPDELGFVFVQINIKLDIDFLPTLTELETEFRVDRDGRLTKSSLRRLQRTLPGYDFEMVAATSLDDLFTLGLIEAAVAKSLAQRPADLPLEGIESESNQDWVQQLPEQLGERKLRLLLVQACRFAFKPQGNLDPEVAEALAALEHFAEMGESKRILRDLRRKFWQEWRVDGDPSYRALHESLNPNDPLPAVARVTQAIASAHKLSDKEALRELRRLHGELLASPE